MQIRKLKHWIENISRILQHCFSLTRESDWQLLCCCHACTLGSSNFLWKTKYARLQSLRWERGSCSEHRWYPYCLMVLHSIVGSRLSLFKTTYENVRFKKDRSSSIIVVTATALRMPDEIKTHSQNVKLITFTLVFFRLALLGGWGTSIINI